MEFIREKFHTEFTENHKKANKIPLFKAQKNELESDLEQIQKQIQRFALKYEKTEPISDNFDMDLGIPDKFLNMMEDFI